MITSCIWHKKRSIIFSPFFLIGNLLHRKTKRPGWVSADELVAAPPTTVGVRKPLAEPVEWGRGGLVSQLSIR